MIHNESGGVEQRRLGAQLHRGCTPSVEQSPKVAVTAQHEVAERKVLPLGETEKPGSQPTD